MKRITWMVLAIWAATAQTAVGQPPADSLCWWFEQGEKDKWLEGVASWQEQADSGVALPEPLQCATLPRSMRPAWARVSDEALWELLQTADERIVHVMGLRSADRSATWAANSAREVTLRRAAGPWKLAALIGGVAFLLTTARVAAAWRRKRLPLRVDSLEWQPLYEAFFSQRWTAEALEQWAALRVLLSEDDTVTDLDRWNQLSRSEQELARYIGQLLPVGVIARRMACSESYVYNLRSSIRQKLKLQPGQDLDAEILRLIGRV